jgi:hypothetical protein
LDYRTIGKRCSYEQVRKLKEGKKKRKERDERKRGSGWCRKSSEGGGVNNVDNVK